MTKRDELSTIKVSETEVVKIDYSEHTNWPETGFGLSDKQFADRAATILHNLALERVGFWRQLFRGRWLISSEPLRNDAANLCRERGVSLLMPINTQLVGGDK